MCVCSFVRLWSTVCVYIYLLWIRKFDLFSLFWSVFVLLLFQISCFLVCLPIFDCRNCERKKKVVDEQINKLARHLMQNEILFLSSILICWVCVSMCMCPPNNLHFCRYYSLLDTLLPLFLFLHILYTWFCVNVSAYECTAFLFSRLCLIFIYIIILNFFCFVNSIILGFDFLLFQQKISTIFVVVAFLGSFLFRFARCSSIELFDMQILFSYISLVLFSSPN